MGIARLHLIAPRNVNFTPGPNIRKFVVFGNRNKNPATARRNPPTNSLPNEKTLPVGSKPIHFKSKR